jgi:phosphoenolpyruvate synthase/pyruvate phosphate dikinase
MYVEPLGKIAAGRESEVGGKASALGQAVRLGMRVPDGYVVLSKASRDWREGVLPPSFGEEVVAAYRALAASRVAVRSSGVLEDSESASWAGQLDSFLDVEEARLLEAIEACWRSPASERATAYAERQANPSAQSAIAVIVQAMVESEVSGVLFTTNPVSGAAGECLIEAVFGLGEMQVQGRTTPDTFVVDGRSGRVKQHHPHRQRALLESTPGGSVEAPLDEARAAAVTLGEAEIAELVEIGARLEAHFGRPQDIEWALAGGQMHLLQSRPVTTVAPAGQAL